MARADLLSREFKRGDEAFMLVRVKLVSQKRPHIWYAEDDNDHVWEVSETWLERVEDVDAD